MLRKLLSGMAIAGVLAGPTSVAVGQDPKPGDIRGIMKHLGFDEDDYDDLMKGEIISTKIKEGSDKELAVSVALLVKGATTQMASQLVRDGKTIEVGRDFLAFQSLESAPPSEGDFAELGLDEGELKEVAKLLKVKKGSEFNFSEAEIEQFQKVAKGLRGRNPSRDPAVREAINETMRSVLLERCRAYQKSGLQGIAPYARSGRKTADPAKELALAIKEDAILPEHLKAFQQALKQYPKGGGETIENDFYWVKRTVQKRPTFILAHRMTMTTPDVFLNAERQFYVGHDYNSLHLVAGCVPVEGGVVVFYRNRTSTDQVAGFGSGMKKGIGRGQMKDSIVEHFETIKRQLINK